MIYLGSRYWDGPIVASKDARRQTGSLSVQRRWPTSKASYTVYEWKDGDRLDLVAYRFFGSTEKWWYILDYNPNILNPVDLVPGDTLRIPNV